MVKEGALVPSFSNVKKGRGSDNGGDNGVIASVPLIPGLPSSC